MYSSYFHRPLSFLAVMLCFVIAAPGDDLGMQRSRMKAILDIVSSKVEKEFWDPGMRGLEWKTLKDQARQKIERAENVNQMVTAIAAMVNKLDDSHTLFVPPMKANTVKFGFDAKAIGDEVRVYDLRKDGAARKAGVEIGDRLLTVNGFNVQRDTYDDMMFYLRVLRPVAGLELTVQRGNETEPRTIRLEGKVVPRPILQEYRNRYLDSIRESQDYWDEHPDRYIEGDGAVGYLFLTTFGVGQEYTWDLLKKVAKSKALILDLRDNGGGRLDTLEDFLGYFEKEKVTVATMAKRNKNEPIKVDPSSPHISGPLFVLVDSGTASASEITARYLQKHHRATVIGDRTAGMVTVARYFPLDVENGSVLFAVNVAVGRFVFPDGEELEKKGVTPDVACLPTGADLREGSDPCFDLVMEMAYKAIGMPLPVGQREMKEKR